MIWRMGNLVTEDAAWAEYLELLPRLAEFRAALATGLQRFATGQGEIRSRIKTWESVREKLMRVGTGRVADISDLVGIRLIVPDVQSLLSVSEAIRKDFRVASMEAQTLGFGDSAIHFVLRAAASFPDDVSAEVYVLTAAENARRTLEQALNYSGPRADSGVSSSIESGIGALTNVLNQFESLIDRTGVHEKRNVHPFLKEHDFILFASPDVVSSEVPIGLGTEYRMDFLVQKPDSSYLLVEIENPQAELFSKSGDFSAGVNHAIRQVEDWQEWIEANLQTVEHYYPGIRAPEAWVVIGRDRNLSSAERRRFFRRNVNMRGRVAIKTYDDLLQDARAYVRSIRGAFDKSLAKN
jgi:ppGpp synthetase/RelA/SpoT-type nucleotidyltranferase